MDVSIAVTLIRGQMGAVVERAVNVAVETVLAEMLKVVGAKFEELKAELALAKRGAAALQREAALREKENDNVRARLRYTELKLKYYRQGVEEELQQRACAAFRGPPEREASHRKDGDQQDQFSWPAAVLPPPEAPDTTGDPSKGAADEAKPPPTGSLPPDACDHTNCSMLPPTAPKVTTRHTPTPQVELLAPGGEAGGAVGAGGADHHQGGARGGRGGGGRGGGAGRDGQPAAGLAAPWVRDSQITQPVDQTVSQSDGPVCSLQLLLAELLWVSLRLRPSAARPPAPPGSAALRPAALDQRAESLRGVQTAPERAAAAEPEPTQRAGEDAAAASAGRPDSGAAGEDQAAGGPVESQEEAAGVPQPGSGSRWRCSSFSSWISCRRAAAPNRRFVPCGSTEGRLSGAPYAALPEQHEQQRGLHPHLPPVLLLLLLLLRPLLLHLPAGLQHGSARTQPHFLLPTEQPITAGHLSQ
ncbi:uncharacterized protein LOC115403193 isoform X2 [Salarias fasciatus]|uniref:uncharacterized protein LOC115403193 isoform X2 n=1 Tax=Salarias fasciatus TaxID=181472 RepID=UPI001176A204|nr:uncharacterized protein LOC115403193 isoform X2 [Salarias fasciatus]